MILKFFLLHRKSVFVLFFVFYSVYSNAQEFVGAKANSALRGEITDSNLKRPLEFATVSLYSLPDSVLIEGSITNRKGEFELRNLNSSTYFIKVEYLGYKAYSSPSIVLKENETHQIKNPINLNIDTKSISEVQVEANRSFSRIELDKTVYNVSKSPVANGGTINDVLATIPKLDVNANGDLQFRGSTNVKVLIDGKISGLLGMNPGELLRNLPAADVDRVEVITSPSAKYDASGAAGIVNIIMKKDRTKGFNGNASATIGTKDKHSASTSLNIRTGKVNVFGTYSYKNDWTGRNSETFRYEYIADPEYLNDDAEVDFGNRSLIGKLGLDYLMDENNTLSFAVTNRNIKQNRNSLFNYSRALLISSSFPVESSRESELDIDLNSWIYNVSYIKKFAKKGQELSVDLAYTDNRADNEGKYLDIYSDFSEDESNDFFKSNREEAVFQIDYVHPTGTSGTIETGFMYRSNEMRYKEPVDVSSAFNYKESIQGLYLQYNGKSGNLGYQFGVRTEYSDIETNRGYGDDYLDFFPSLNLSYKLTNNKQLKLSYSKMVYRPDSGMLNPYQNKQDPANQRLGNQELNAYYTHISELSFMCKREKVTYTTNLYYLYYNNIISQLRTIDSDRNAIVSYENLDEKHYAGIDFNVSTQINKWWSINSYMSGIYEKYSPTKNLNYSTSDEYYFVGKITSTMQIPKLFNFQATFKYQSDVPVAQGKVNELYYVDLAFGKRLMKGKASLSLWIYDVFNTNKIKVNTHNTQFSQRVNYNYESRIANLTFRYFFGKKYNVLKAKSRNSESHHTETDI